MQAGVKIAIAGKGGVGKTTVCAVWARIIAGQGFEVLAIDADSNSNLASAFGIANNRRPTPLIKMKELIAERTGTDGAAVAAYFRLNPDVGDLPEQYWLTVAENLKLLVLGDISQAGGGCACPEGAFLKAMLTHIVLQRQEVVLVDLAAGVEFMGRASVQGVDALVVVVEPGQRSVETAANIARMARQLGIKQVTAVANKLTDESQSDFIRQSLPDVPLLSGVQFDSAAREADLQSRDVYESCPEMVEQLRQARDKLAELLSGSVRAGR